MKFGEYQFGYADSTKELMIAPEIFESAFYDPHDILNAERAIPHLQMRRALSGG